jgi:hypothetical protein
MFCHLKHFHPQPPAFLETAEVSLPEKMLVFALDYWTMSLEYPA